MSIDTKSFKIWSQFAGTEKDQDGLVDCSDRSFGRAKVGQHWLSGGPWLLCHVLVVTLSPFHQMNRCFVALESSFYEYAVFNSRPTTVVLAVKSWLMAYSLS